MKKRLFLIDAHGLAYRAYFALPGFSSSKGEVTNAIYGFTRMLQKLFREESPEFIAIIFDSKTPTFRHITYSEYKAQRAKMPDDFREQIHGIHEIIKAYNICSVNLEGYEADDLMGTIAKRLKDEVDEVILVTNDKDMFQLVDGKVKVLATKKGLSETILYDAALIEKEFGVPPERMTDLLGLAGDSSDNVPGVPGIGPKKAVELIHELGGIEEILANIERVKNSRDRERLSSNKDDALLSKRLVTVDTDAPLDLTLEECRWIGPDTDRLKDLFLQYEFKSLLKELVPPERRKTEGKIVKDKKGLEELIKELRSSSSFVIDLERDKGICLGLDPERIYYLPFKDGDRDYILKELSSVFEDGSILKWGCDLKGTIIDLLQSGIELRGIDFDVALAAFLLKPSSRNPSLDSVIFDYLNEGVSKDSPFERSASILKVTSLVKRELEEKGLTSLFENIELKLLPVLAQMEQVGVKIDTDHLNRMSKELGEELSLLQEDIHRLAGVEFNINSPKQLSHVLFEKLSLPPLKRTKTGYSTDEEVLRALAPLDELPTRLLEYREMSKLKSTYVDTLPKLVDPKTRRVHTSYSQTTTATGRLASSNPNLQNIPVRTELGRKIRHAFVPEEGYLFLSGDYSQVELRILAHISGDGHLKEAFREGKDIHRLTASWVFGVDEDQVTFEMRDKAKVINFGIIYGMSSYGLSRELGILPQEAQAFIDRYFEFYSGVRGYVEGMIKEARTKGYVTTFWHRRRELPDINSKNRNLKEMAERVAINTPIQGSAADLIKQAMLRIHGELKGRNLISRMLLQVHDELLFEVKREEEDEVRKIVIEGMENCAHLDIPLKVSIKTGNTWGEIH